MNRSSGIQKKEDIYGSVEEEDDVSEGHRAAFLIGLTSIFTIL
jgi:hypothetical protein